MDKSLLETADSWGGAGEGVGPGAAAGWRGYLFGPGICEGDPWPGLPPVPSRGRIHPTWPNILPSYPLVETTPQ